MTSALQQISPVAAVILAAGASRRMGTAKALLPWQGVPLIVHMCRTFHHAGVESVCIVVAPGCVGDAIREQLAALPFTRLVVNAAPERGMLSSVQVALRSLTQDDVSCRDFLVCPVDLPLLEAQHVAPLIPPLPAPFKIAVPTWAGKHGHPTRFSGTLASEILSLDPETVGLNHLVRRYDFVGQVYELPAPDAAVLRDADTPEEWAALVEVHRSAGNPE